MNKKHLAEVLEQARLWTNAQYEAKGGFSETDRYFMHQQSARLTLIRYIEETYIEQRENAQL